MERSELVVIGGPNGAGKTTFAQEFLATYPVPYLSADLIAARLSPKKPEDARVPAGREFLNQVRKRLESNESFLVESTLSGRTFMRTIERAKSHGFRIQILFVYLSSADACVARVRQRASKGGHDVPEVDVRRRYQRSLHNFWTKYRPMADTWLLSYNEGDMFVKVAHKSSAGDSVSDDELLHAFLQLAGVRSNA